MLQGDIPILIRSAIRQSARQCLLVLCVVGALTGCVWDDADDYEVRFGDNAELLSWCFVEPDGYLQIDVRQIRFGSQYQMVAGRFDPAAADLIYRHLREHLRRRDVANLNVEMSVARLCADQPSEQPPNWLRLSTDGTFVPAPPRSAPAATPTAGG